MPRSAVEALMSTYLPDHVVRSVVPAGAGLDNETYEVDGEFVVRFRKDDGPGVEREARLLDAVAQIAPLPVPRPVFVAPGPGCLAYRKLPGVPLLDVPPERRSVHAGPLRDFLTALHTADGSRWAGLVDVDVVPLEDWRQEAADHFREVAARIPVTHHRGIEDFLSAPVPAGPDEPVFSHNDLGAEHVLVDPDTSRITGIIDWTDAALADPAYDFGLLLRDLGPAADIPAAYRERAVFYARCKALEDLGYGLSAGRDAYLRNGLASMQWLFA